VDNANPKIIPKEVRKLLAFIVVAPCFKLITQAEIYFIMALYHKNKKDALKVILTRPF
jgi:hypothetical protein